MNGRAAKIDLRQRRSLKDSDAGMNSKGRWRSSRHRPFAFHRGLLRPPAGLFDLALGLAPRLLRLALTHARIVERPAEAVAARQPREDRSRVTAGYLSPRFAATRVAATYSSNFRSGSEASAARYPSRRSLALVVQPLGHPRVVTQLVVGPPPVLALKSGAFEPVRA